MTLKTAIALSSILIWGTACTTTPLQQPSPSHIRKESAPTPTATANIPQPVQHSLTLPQPKATPKTETYSVVVNNVKVQDLLFALARDAKLNVDIHPGIYGAVTLNAIDQTLPQLLTRIAKQVDMRFELDGPNLVVMPDSPFLRTYKVDYVNMSRDVSGTVAINTQITTTGSIGTASGSGGTAGSGSNNSTTEVRNTTRNHFWESLDKNIKDILRETDKILPEGSSETVTERREEQSTTGTGAPPAGRGNGRGEGAPSSLAGSPNPANLQSSGATVVRRTTFREAASVIINPEAGIVVVRATSRQHEKIQEFLDLVGVSSKRQVLIETTIVEVALSDQYQQGINWSRLRLDGTGFSLSQQPAGTSPAGVTQSLFVLKYTNPGSILGNIATTISLLESFGTVKVLSSPKMSVLNNQTALLKVVDNIVYFQVKSDTTTPATGPSLTTFTTTPHSVSVGLVMSVTPQISENDAVLLNVRPTISRVTGFKTDPNPSIPATIPNEIPEIQTREMESVLRVQNGDIAVMGGLMEDRMNYKDDAVPGLSKIPYIGNLFTHRNDTSTKTELVIFLRPVIIRDASISGDYSNFREQLPGQDFFEQNAGPRQPSLDPGVSKR